MSVEMDSTVGRAKSLLSLELGRIPDCRVWLIVSEQDRGRRGRASVLTGKGESHLLVLSTGVMCPPLLCSL